MSSTKKFPYLNTSAYVFLLIPFLPRINIKNSFDRVRVRGFFAGMSAICQARPEEMRGGFER